MDQEDLEPKDYVKAFLSPLIPTPTFGVLVDMIDQASKGNYVEAYFIYMTQSVPAAIVLGGMGIIDALTGSRNLRGYSEALTVLKLFRYLKASDNFENLVKNKCPRTSKEIKTQTICLRISKIFEPKEI